MADLARVRTIFTGVAGTPWYSNMYFLLGGTTGAVWAATVADFWDQMAVLINANVDYQVQPEIAILDDATGDLVNAQLWAGANGSGLSSTEALPFANQGVILWNTAQFIGGRQLRGKTFVPGLTQTANDQGQLQAGTQEDIQAIADDLVGADNVGLVVYSPTNHTSGFVGSATVSSTIGVLRSRRD